MPADGLLGEGFPADEEVVGRLAFEDEFHGALTHLRVKIRKRVHYRRRQLDGGDQISFGYLKNCRGEFQPQFLQGRRSLGESGRGK